MFSVYLHVMLPTMLVNKDYYNFGGPSPNFFYKNKTSFLCRPIRLPQNWATHPIPIWYRSTRQGVDCRRPLGLYKFGGLCPPPILYTKIKLHFRVTPICLSVTIFRIFFTFPKIGPPTPHQFSTDRRGRGSTIVRLY